MAARSLIIIDIQSEMLADDYIQFESNLNGIIKTYRIGWIDPEDEGLHGDIGVIGLFDIPIESSVGYTTPNYDARSYGINIEEFDYLNQLSVSRIGDVVTIQSKVNELLFQNDETNNIGVSMTVTNQVGSVDPFEIDSVVISAGSSDPCNYVTVTVQTSELADIITSPLSVNPNANNPFSFQYLRGQKLVISLASTNLGQVASKKLATPQKLSEFDVTVETSSSNLGNSATVTYASISIFAVPLTLEYSLDGTNYSSSNVFPNLVDGSYIVYVRDSFGCVVQKSFNFVDDTVKLAYNYIPKTNSFRFAKEEVWDNINIFKNDENTLSHETIDGVSHCELQRFQTSDNIVTQIRSNYDTIVAKVIDGDQENSLLVSKPREYLNLKDHRDCVIFRFDNGKTGVYFTSGDKYDYTTNTKIGEFTLNGALPVWFKVGSSIDLNNVGVLEIKSVFFDEEKGVEVAEVDYNYTGSPILSKVKSIYNLRNFNLFEFNTSFLNYQDKKVRVKIIASDPDLPTLTWNSEILDIKQKHEDCLELRYYNTKNGDIFYETGIKNLIRIPLLRMKDSPTSESEIHTGDDKVSLVSAEYYEGDEIEFLPLTKELSKKVELALKHTQLTINKIGYRLAETPEKTPQADSNLYLIKVKMIKAGSSYNTNSIINAEDNISIDLPEIILSGDDEFIIS